LRLFTQRWLPAARWRRWVAGAVFVAPLVYAGAQTWHRFADAFGTTPVRVRGAAVGAAVPAVDSPAFRHTLSALTQTTMQPGHHVELLVDGPATLARIDRDLASARSVIAVQNYYCEPGDVADWFKTRLIERARAGVAVYFLRDGFGCRSLTRGWLDSVRAAGGNVATLRPVRWWTMHESMHRSHVRIVMVDGRVGYVGGFGLADKWVDRDGAPRWRETSVRFTGPAVAQLAGAFAVGWGHATGDLLSGDALFANGQPVSGDRAAIAGVLFTQRAYGMPVPERFLALALAGARKRVYIANSYFVPNHALRTWLVAAARRGVDVRVLAPSAAIDIPFTRAAGRSTFPELLRGGVRLYEYQPAMMHAKTMVIDDAFVAVGSLNLDNLSLRINDEAVLLVHDVALADTMVAQFTRDLTQSVEITPASLRASLLRERMLTAVARLVRDLL
ncbi:MAG: phospholipase D-like domain-containing protein, partial [Gemmatimonadaceae bacterium]